MRGCRAWRPALAGVALLVAALAHAAVDVDALWDFSRPDLSEQRLREALAMAADRDARLVIQTQIARTYSLRARFDDAHRTLDSIEPQLAQAGAEVRVRWLLERGRTFRSAGDAARARPLFEQAFAAADAAGQERLAGDALHMSALAAEGLEARSAWNRRTAAYARAARDPRARAWAATALNNLGSDLREAGRLDESLAVFRDALTAFEAGGDARRIRVARWQVANVLRLLGQTDEALRLQQALERDATAANEPDPYIHEELAQLHERRGDAERAAHYRSLLARQKTRP